MLTIQNRQSIEDLDPLEEAGGEGGNQGGPQGQADHGQFDPGQEDLQGEESPRQRRVVNPGEAGACGHGDDHRHVFLGQAEGGRELLSEQSAQFAGRGLPADGKTGPDDDDLQDDMGQAAQDRHGLAGHRPGNGRDRLLPLPDQIPDEGCDERGEDDADQPSPPRGDEGGGIVQAFGPTQTDLLDEVEEVSQAGRAGPDGHAKPDDDQQGQGPVSGREEVFLVFAFHALFLLDLVSSAARLFYGNEESPIPRAF